MIDLLVFDLETTGVDAHNDLIVTAYVGLLGRDGQIQREQEWIVNPGIPVPEGAAAVHGWTDERLATDPRVRHDLDDVVREIAHLIHAVTAGTGTPLAGHNLSYDLTMLNAHLIRAGQPALVFGRASGISVLDSLVLDKHFNRYVKGTGQRKLTPTAARYGVHLTEEQAHDASFDALASGRICQAIIARYAPHTIDTPITGLANLHSQQVAWRRDQQLDLQKWLRTPKPRGGGEPDAVCETEWPTHNTQGATA